MSEGPPPAGEPPNWGPPQQGSQAPPPSPGQQSFPQPAAQQPGAWQPGTTQSSGTQPVVIPGWVGSDWMLALKVAGIGLLVLLVAGAVIALLNALQTMAGPGLSAVDWAAVALSPVLVVIGWAGGGAGAPLYLTGIVYVYIAFRVAARLVAPEVSGLTGDRTRLFAGAVKIGIVMAGLLLAAGLLVNSFASDMLFRVGLGASTQIDLTSLVFFSMFIGALTGLFALLAVGSTTLVGALGLTGSLPAVVRYGMIGARRTLIIGASALVALFTLGALLDSFSQTGVGLGDALALLLGRIVSLLLSGVDTAMLLVLGATKFLHEGGYVWAPFASLSGWMWLSIPVLIGAFVAGGIQAARSARPGSQAEAAKAALLVGPGVALVGLLVAIGWAGQEFIDDIVPIALLLPSLWGVVAIAGAWLWANQQGLPPGLAVGQVPNAAAPPHMQPQAQQAPPPAEPQQPYGHAPSPAQPPYAATTPVEPTAASPDDSWPEPASDEQEWAPPTSSDAPPVSEPDAAWGPPVAPSRPDDSDGAGDGVDDGGIDLDRLPPPSADERPQH